MAIKQYSLDPDSKLSAKQIEQIREAAKQPITYDDDCPELSDQQLMQFKRVHAREAVLA